MKSGNVLIVRYGDNKVYCDTVSISRFHANIPRLRKFLGDCIERREGETSQKLPVSQLSHPLVLLNPLPEALGVNEFNAITNSELVVATGLIPTVVVAVGVPGSSLLQLSIIAR